MFNARRKEKSVLVFRQTIKLNKTSLRNIKEKPIKTGEKPGKLQGRI